MLKMILQEQGTLGGFSEYILVPNVKKNHSLYQIDKRISDKLASLIEPLL